MVHEQKILGPAIMNCAWITDYVVRFMSQQENVVLFHIGGY